MAYSVDSAIEQVLTRLAEAAGSQVAELPADGGPAASPDIATNDQVLIFLNEGQDELTRLGILMTYAGGSKSDIAAGTPKVLYTALTMDTSGQRMFQVREAKWTPTGGTASPLAVCDRQWYERHYPAILTQARATPEHIYRENDGTLLAPIPDAEGTLMLSGVVFPRAGALAGSFADLPQDLAPRLIAYGCAALARQNSQEAALAAVLPIWEAEWRGVPPPTRRRK